jgi:hypothetical protein
MRPASVRRGALLVIVTGLTAMLFGLAVTFLFRIRGDAEEIRLVLRETQARMMLAAGCAYVQEAARLGYDTYFSGSRPTGVASTTHEECFGWIDVRDGSIGPNTEDFNGDGVWDPRWSPTLAVATGEGAGTNHPTGPVSRPNWPAMYAVARCPLYVMERSPYAIEPTMVYNPINAVPTSDPTYGMPYLRNPDPRPVAATRAANATGDRFPRQHTLDKAWFRLYRDAPSTFVLTCGSGGTRGFKHWDEVVAQGMEHEFGFDAGLFNLYRENESILWYRIEWSGAVLSPDHALYFHESLQMQGWDHYLQSPRNASQLRDYMLKSVSNPKNPLGTITWIQRLREEPTLW